MFKIAAIFLATSMCAGVLIAGPGVASKGSAPSPAIVTVKVKTIAIHAPGNGAKPTPFYSDRLDGSELFAGPASAEKTGQPHDA